MSFKAFKKKIRKLIKRSFRRKRSKTVVYLTHELQRRDRQIAELQEKNQVLLSTTMRQSHEILELKHRIYEFTKR